MKGYLTILLALVMMLRMGSCGLFAQHLLHPSSFDLQEVTLHESPFLRAQERNYQTLMEYDVKRLLTPYVRQSGLSQTIDGKSPYYQWEYEHPAFTSFAWNPALAMDGHMLGHYLSALSFAYASCHDEGERAAFKERIDYIIHVLHDCQDVFENDKSGMKGFIGGIPDNSVWTSLLDADYRVYNQRGNWVPFYCEHKVMAGLRDAYVYGGNEEAKEMFRKMCDWIIQVVSLFGLDVMEMQILQWETGAMNEVLADAYCLFADTKYLKAAQKFSHQLIIENMANANRSPDFLDKRHTNELTAMFLGFARISNLKRDSRYLRSARNYWDEVVGRRTMVNGGVGVGGYFVAGDKSASLITNADGPDLCTTWNLMKMAKTLHEDDRLARYADYYELAMLNHILASMDPETGGFSYFTPMRPESYRIYSKVNEAMWCCAGSGLESQSRYGEFIYTMAEDTLFVNLFVASELDNERVALAQETDFPYGQQSHITIRKPGNYHLAVRHPGWTTEDFSVKVNGKPVKVKEGKVVAGQASYLDCGKSWKAGDVIEIDYPMELTFVTCPNNGDYIAMRYGPSVLAAQTTSLDPGSAHFDPLPREYGGDGMHDFSPQSREKFPSLAYAPMLICPMDEVSGRVKVVDANRLKFEVDASAKGSSWQSVPVCPFYDLHHARYSIYWNRQLEEDWLRSPLFKDQLRKKELELLTLDQLTPGESGSETAHQLQISETGSRGTLNGHPFRDAQPDQWFEYTMDAARAAELIDGGQEVALSFMFSISDRGRSCAITIDGADFENYEVPQQHAGTGKGKFFDEVFRVPSSLLQGKKNIVLRMSSTEGSFVPRFYQIRLMKYDEALLKQ